ncbi:MAG: MarC family protein [Pseudomonadales bacterium]|jgi:multiple antibiotic resistance protein|nr:MarC family protein [Pseudomonadales bacterium]
MFETAAVAFTTLFATIGPIEAAALFATLTPRASPSERRRMALRASAIAGLLMLVFALGGEFILGALGISLPALRTAGGVLLLLMGIDMVFARHSGVTSTTADEAEEASHKQDLSVFPLATPLIAGPGALGAVILLMADAEGDLLERGVVLLALGAVMLLTLSLLLVAVQIQKLLGVTGMNVLTRILGVLLTALAVQFMFDGLAASGLFGEPAASVALMRFGR